MSLKIASIGIVEQPVFLQCSEEGDLIVVKEYDTTIQKVACIELTMYNASHAQRMKKVQIALDQANNRKLLSELIERRLPFINDPPTTFYRGFLKAVCWDKHGFGRDWGDGWTLFGHEDVMEVIMYYESTSAKRRKIGGDK